MLGLWPGGKELSGKKHRSGGLSSWRLRLASAGCGGLIRRPAGRPYPERTPSSEVQRVGPPRLWSGSRLMVFARKFLAPGPGTRLMATFRWRPFQSALSGSLFFIPPPLVEVMIWDPSNYRDWKSRRNGFSRSIAEINRSPTPELQQENLLYPTESIIFRAESPFAAMYFRGVPIYCDSALRVKVHILAIHLTLSDS